ncbi:LuxR C-terminal-related transcriptional regulator [Kitasatospora sp. NPDC057223]|uniref:LuxR C-terminal-related transcriptional regulator n=1 Tax=Kitasatospora sp. NPDC057223 TaxID=3346055 RepID=UPI0036392724
MTEPPAGLIGSAARELYLAILGEGGQIRARDMAPDDAPSLERLLQLGLVVARVEDAAYATVNPRTVGSRIGADLRATGVRLLGEADEVPALLGDLTHAYDSAPRKPDRTGVVEHVQDVAKIRHRIAQLDADCTEEILAAQPGGAGPSESMPDALERIRLLVERGGVIRGIYRPGVRTDAVTSAYAAAATELGCRYRVLAEPFTRMLVYDRRVAVIPADADSSSAAFVEDPTVVDFLVESFERDWQEAQRVQWADGARNSTDRRPVQDQVGAMLASGLTQRAIASRLGLSERTVAGHIARLRELHDVETLFQLGWQMRGAAAGGGRGKRHDR